MRERKGSTGKVGPSGALYAFQLTVSDGELSDSELVLIEVANVNQPPLADAGTHQTAFEGVPVTLTGRCSSDPDGDSLDYSWRNLGGPALALADADSPAPTFVAPAVGPGGIVLEFELTVFDGVVYSAPSAVTVTGLDTNDPPACGLAAPSAGSIWPPNHKLVPVQIVGITDPNDDQVTVTITGVTQPEPTNGLGDGDTPLDAVITGSTVLLRAERAGNRNGRVYVIHFVADDGDGGARSGSVRVVVPHSPRSTPVDDGQAFDSTLGQPSNGSRPRSHSHWKAAPPRRCSTCGGGIDASGAGSSGRAQFPPDSMLVFHRKARTTSISWSVKFVSTIEVPG